MSSTATVDVDTRRAHEPSAQRVVATAPVIIGIMVVALAIRLWRAVWPYATASDRFPNSDGASHVMLGIQMADALRHGNVLGFLKQIYDCSPWPPLYFVAETPMFLLFGNHFHVAAAMTPFLLVGCITGIYLVGVETGGVEGVVMGAIAAALMAASPIVQSFGALIMLEVPGTFLLMLAMIAAVRYRRTESIRDARLACIAAFALFMLKFNYGLLWIVSLVASEIGHSVPAPSRMWSMAMEFLRGRRWLSPIGLGGIVAIVALGFVATHRGSVVTLAGRRWTVPGLRDPLVMVIALGLVAFLAHARDNLRRLRGWFASLHPAARNFLVLVALPIVVWLGDPSHMKEFLVFLSNRSSNFPLLGARNLLFYPWSFLKDYSPSVGMGVVVLAVALVSVARIPFLPPARRLIAVALGVGLAFTTIHHFKENRFFFLVAPLVWLSCGITIADLLSRVTAGLRSNARAATLAAVAVVAIVATAVFGLDGLRLRRWFDSWTAQGSIEPVLAAVTDVNVSSQGTVLIGTWDRFAPHLVWWYQRYHHPEARAAARPKNPLWYNARFTGISELIDTSDIPAGPLLDGIAADHDVQRVIVLSLPPTAPVYWSRFDIENAWAHPVRAMIASDPRFQLETVRQFPDSGYEMRVYRIRGA
jgi:hypothetical protein